MEKTPRRLPAFRKLTGLLDDCGRKVKEGGAVGIVQSGLKGMRWWQYAVKHYCFSQNIAVVDGDSSYNQRLKKGHPPGLKIPFGTAIDFLPQPDAKREGLESKTMRGCFGRLSRPPRPDMVWRLSPRGIQSFR